MDFRISVAIQFLTDNLGQNLSLTEVAEYVRLSPCYLDRLFKTETGLSFKQYAIRLRMQLAAELLINSFLSVREIRNRLGVQDHSHFVRDFKKTYGRPPVEYRKHQWALKQAKKTNAAQNSPLVHKTRHLPCI
jgi:two-component system, response regulator YesN